MSRRARWTAGAAVVTLAALAQACGAGESVWSHPDLEHLRPDRIAILPAVSFVYLPTQRAYVEDAWLKRFETTHHHWIPAILCRERMAGTSKGGDSLLAKIGDQVRSRGRVDSLSSSSLAKLLQCQAMLCLRIDRWERLGRGGNERVFVDMTASLVDASGRLLWKATSEERLESVYGLPKQGGPGGSPPPQSEDDDMRRVHEEGLQQHASSGRPGEMGMTGQVTTIALDFQTALDHILTRWAKAFPTPPSAPATPH
jgi:hypothetical protein